LSCEHSQQCDASFFKNGRKFLMEPVRPNGFQLLKLAHVCMAFSQTRF
jgi:hypothetical protein